MKPGLVIFDCDGVLVDSEIPSNQVMRDNLALYGLDMTLVDCMAAFVGSSMQGVADKAREMGADLPSNWQQNVGRKTLARLQQGVDLVPGIVEVLDVLDRAGIPYCVASNGPVEKMRVTLGQNNLWTLFEDRMFSAHVLGVAKPKPDLFLTAARHFAIQPVDCVVIEDSTSGVIAARRAGMRCLGYVPEGDGQALEQEGATVFNHMDALPEMLGVQS